MAYLREAAALGQGAELHESGSLPRLRFIVTQGGPGTGVPALRERLGKAAPLMYNAKHSCTRFRNQQKATGDSYNHY